VSDVDTQVPPAATLDAVLWSSRQRARLVRLCRAIVRDPVAAEDLAQETLLEAWRHQDKLTDPSGADAWLSAIGRNVCRRWLHAQGRRPLPTPDPESHRSADTVAKKAFVTDTAVMVGGSIPGREMGFQTTLTLFRNFRIYAQLDGKYDYKIYNLTKDFRDRNQKNSAEVNLPAGQGGYSLYEFVRRAGPFVTQTAGTAVGNALARDAYIVDGDYLRFREFSVTWTLPTALANRMRVAGSSISVGGRNLHLWTKYDGRDPEVNGADGLTNQFRADVETLPQVRRAFARLNLQF